MAGDGARRSSSRRGGDSLAAMESRSGLRDLWSTSGLDRTAAFSDAVLAIAMTILVLDLKAPDVAGRREYDAAQPLREVVLRECGEGVVGDVEVRHDGGRAHAWEDGVMVMKETR